MSKIPERYVLDQDYLRLMLYGDPRTAKTYFSATACEVGSVAYWDCGSSPQTLFYTKRFQSIQNDVWKIQSIDDFTDLFHAFALKTPKYKTRSELCLKYDFLIIDELDNLWYHLMRERLAEVTEKKPDRSDWIPAMDDYGVVRAQMLYMFKELLQLPIHIIVTSWVDRGKGIDGKTILRPSLPGKLAGEIPGDFDVVGYTTIGIDRKGENITYDVNFGPSKFFVGGVKGDERKQSLGLKLENSDMSEFMKLWRIV